MRGRARRFHRPGSRLLAGMLLLSLLAPVLRGPLGAVGSIMQVLVPVQHTLQAVTPDAARDEAEQEIESLKNRIASLEASNGRLKTENRELSLLRTTDPYLGKLISAQVVAGDPLAWRASRTLDRGTLTGVAQHELVISNVFSVRAGEKQGVLDGMTVLSSEALVGEIQDVGTYTSRVVLQSDPAATPLVVRIVPADGGADGPDDEFVLEGVGRGRMRLQLSHQYIEKGRIARGDSVVTAPGDSRLPGAIRVGSITAWQQHDTNSSLYNVFVEAPAEIRDLKRVYVVDPSPDREP